MGSSKRSAGLVLYRFTEGRLEVLIAHMGGPLWSDKVARGKRGWSIPKGEYTEGEQPLDAACREAIDKGDGQVVRVGAVQYLGLGELQ